MQRPPRRRDSRAVPKTGPADNAIESGTLSESVRLAENTTKVSSYRHWNLALSLASCFVCVLLGTLLMSLFSHAANGTGGFLFWVANGTLLAYLLLVPRWHWPAYLMVGFAALLGGAALTDGHLNFGIALQSSLNLCEVLFAAQALRPKSTVLPQFSDLGYLLRFLGYAVVAAPVAAGSIFTLFEVLVHHSSVRTAFFTWTVADGVGTAVTTPALVAIFQAGLKKDVNWRRDWIYPVLLVAVTLAAFAQSTLPLLFLVYPVLVLTLLRLGLAWSTLLLLFVAFSSGSLTWFGLGPFAALAILHYTDPSVLLQLFIATGMFILYSVSVAIEKQNATERKLSEIVNLHRLVTKNSRDVIIVADFDGSRSYVSDAVSTMGGWTPEELQNQGSLDLVHPLDKPLAVSAIRDVKNGGDGARLELRIRKVDGEYLWVESVLRTIRNPVTGVPKGILNIVRDISERKRAEQELQEAYRAVEALAETDALTRLANRRRFDHYLTSEWRRSMRDHTPISLLMIDADYFKSYNDTYGHTRGDSALKQIAEAAQDVVTRPGDLVARFGGEEFAVILPNTDSEGAAKVAHEICTALSDRRLAHTANPLGYLTLSIGFATTVASFGHHSVNLIETADQALYQAKKNGRNQVFDGNALWPVAEDGQSNGEVAR